MPITTTGAGTSETRARSVRTFDLGGAGRVTSIRPFDILAPNVLVTSVRPFDIQGVVLVTSERPFDLGSGGLFVTSIRPFDILDESTGQTLTDVIHVPPQTERVNAVQRIIVQATGGTYTLTFDGQTTAPIAWDADAATVQSALEGLSNIDPGDVDVTEG